MLLLPRFVNLCVPRGDERAELGGSTVVIRGLTVSRIGGFVSPRIASFDDNYRSCTHNRGIPQAKSARILCDAWPVIVRSLGPLNKIQATGPVACHSVSPVCPSR